MEEFEFAELLTLLFIKQVRAFRRDYELTKLLSRRFNIIYWVKISKSIREKGLVDFKSIKASYHYQISKLGNEYLNKNYTRLLKHLHENFPDQKELVDNVTSLYPLNLD